MKIGPQVRALLPLRRDVRRCLASISGDTTLTIYSGAMGVRAADELEVLIVTAVNSHEALVVALSAMVAANAAGEEVSLDEFRAATEALVMAAKP